MSKTGERIRRPKAGSDKIFEVLFELFYNISAPLNTLARKVDLSASTVKRILKQFRECGIVKGNVGSTITVDLAHCNELDSGSACSAILFIAIDIPRLKQGYASVRDENNRYDTEEDLFEWIKYSFARKKPHKGRVIVEEGYILPNEKEFRVLVKMHAFNVDALRGFTIELRDSADCITRINTSVFSGTMK